MTTTVRSTAIVVADPAFSDPERFALAGFLAGYHGLTRDAYALDLRQFAAWCDRRQLRLFQPRWAWAVGVLLLVLYTVKILAFDV